MSRRSTRRRCKKNSSECSGGNSDKKQEIPKREVTDSANNEVCCKCAKEDSPANKVEEDTWIDCDICGKW